MKNPLLVLPLLACLTATGANADGGQILLHQASGVFALTVFASPEPLSTGDADLSVLVQDGASQQPLLDADLSLCLQPPQGPPQLLTLYRPATNQLLRSVNYHFTQPGRWTLTVSTQRGSARSVATADFDVAASHSRLILICTFVSLPLLLIALFVAHQRLKTRGKQLPPTTCGYVMPSPGPLPGFREKPLPSGGGWIAG